MRQTLLSIEPEVQEALKYNKPAAAIESSFIAHGLPYPQNYHLALEMLEIIREHGVVPAVTAVIDGKIKIGLSMNQIEEMSFKGGLYFKASASDFGALLAAGRDGATTVAGTIYAASLAGIKACVTGGIGGVHRGAAQSLDISQDLTCLSRFPVTVVSSGVKSILDLKLTLEYLETNGVPIIGYRTGYFPSFYTHQSSYELHHSVDSSRKAARMIKMYELLGWQGGILIANPVPQKDSLSEEFINRIIEKGLKEVTENNIRGKMVTPFLLNYLSQESGGQCLKTNISLLKNNAELGAKISRDLLGNNK